MAKLLKQFGGKATETNIQQCQNSLNWHEDKFHNLEFTSMSIKPSNVPSLLYSQFFKTKGRNPISPLPIIPFDKKSFLTDSQEAKIIWYGHSVILMRMSGKTILIDPMLGPNASPIAPFATKRFSHETLAIIDQLPEIDLLLMSHDHYDHLDLASIEKLQSKTKQYFVGMGLGRHLESWGIKKELITEFDWWSDQTFKDINITYTPTRHFSGRGLTDRAKSLWGGWVFTSPKENIYFSGDSGYGNHFIEVGEKLGPFDFGIMECGQYNELWHQIHMYPEESIRAAKDAGVKKAMAVHWAGFALALHHWKDPIERFTTEADKENLQVSNPRIGEIFTKSSLNKEHWWEDLT
ncbi:MAG: L-ascorbate metabolism protein UlaG (beta-lactamase superfamily) [Cyclobacteriaceae bacterium]|jgi:L-ascorbate metabolism protein UlaG (beta-lactamase superfamily)